MVEQQCGSWQLAPSAHQSLQSRRLLALLTWIELKCRGIKSATKRIAGSASICKPELIINQFEGELGSGLRPCRSFLGKTRRWISYNQLRKGHISSIVQVSS